MKVFKLVLLGDAEVGKSSFIERLMLGTYQESYEATNGVELARLTFRTNRGNVGFIVWDTAGREELGGLRDGYYIKADCAIIMFDVTSMKSNINLEKWHRDIVRACSQIPVVFCGNKVEMTRNRMVNDNSATFGRKNNLVYYDISAKLNYNMEKPFLYLSRQLLKDPKLEFVTNFEPPKLVTMGI